MKKLSFLETQSILLKDVDVVLEIGSRWGQDSKRLKELFPTAKVYSFECTPSSIEIWKKNVKNEDNILVEKAASDFIGEATFYISDKDKTKINRGIHPDGNQGINSLLKFNNEISPPDIQYVMKEITVSCTTIQNWAKENGIKKIDVLWIDAQGSELQVLTGMGDLLKTVRAIHTEVEFYPMYFGQALFPEVHAFLEEAGFEFVYFENKATQFADANYVKVKEDPKELVIKIEYGGLGDHLLHSHLPRLAKEKQGYDRVYISNHSNYNNPNTKRLVWEYNSFVDGVTDEDGPYPQFGSVVEGKNILDAVADFYGFQDDGGRFREPEVYYKPKFIKALKDAVIFEPNHGNAYGIPSKELVEEHFVKNNIAISHHMKLLHSDADAKNVQIVTTDSLEQFCDVIYSCKAFYCFTSGVATLAAALGKPTTVLFVDGINPMFHHSKLHSYIRLG